MTFLKNGNVQITHASAR